MESVADILEPLAPMLAQAVIPQPPQQAPAGESDQQNIEEPVKRSPSETKLLTALGHDSMSLDELTERTGFDTKTVTNLTLDLELEGIIKKIAGGNFVKTNG